MTTETKRRIERGHLAYTVSVIAEHQPELAKLLRSDGVTALPSCAEVHHNTDAVIEITTCGSSLCDRQVRRCS